MRHIGIYFASALFSLACAHAEDGAEMDDDMSGGSAGNGGAAGKGGSMSKGGFAGVVGSGGSVSGAGGKASGGAAGNVGTGGSSGGSAGTSNPAGGTAGASGGTGGTSGGTGGASGGTGGTGQAGTGGAAGNCSDLGMGGGPTSAGFTVRYKVENAGTPGTSLGSEIRIVNAGADTIPLSELKLHYYITDEVTAMESKNINWSFIEPNGGGGQSPLSGVTLNVVSMCSPVGMANAYVEISFGSGTLAPGQNAHFSWTVQNGATQNWNQDNDWSFDASKTNIADWDHLVLRRNGLVIYGQDPT